MNGLIVGLLIPFLGTVLGSAFVFFMKKDMPVLLQKALLGFASGVRWQPLYGRCLSPASRCLLRQVKEL